jgi:hypothetical protein
VFIIELCLVICKAIHSHFYQQSCVFCRNFFGRSQHQNPPSFHHANYFIPLCFHDLNKFCEVQMSLKGMWKIIFKVCNKLSMTRSQLLEGLKCVSQIENSGRTKSWGMLPGSQHFGRVEGHVGASGWDWEELTSFTYSHGPLYKTNTRWFVHSWSILVLRWATTTQIHHYLDLGEATTFPLIVYFMPLHEVHIQMAFCLRTPKWESWNCQSRDSRDFGGP